MEWPPWRERCVWVRCVLQTTVSPVHQLLFCTSMVAHYTIIWLLFRSASVTVKDQTVNVSLLEITRLLSLMSKVVYATFIYLFFITVDRGEGIGVDEVVRV